MLQLKPLVVNMSNLNGKQKCGYIAIVGPTNAGKSTLLNTILGKKLSIVSRKIQTTRTRIQAVLTKECSQLILIDTPGIFNPKRFKDRSYIKEATLSLEHADIIVYMLEANKRFDKDAFMSLSKMTKNQRILIIINKIDLVKKPDLLKLMDDIKDGINQNDIYLLSALKNDGVRVFLDGLISKIPEKEWELPANQATNISDKFLAEEFTREKILNNVHKEIPYSVIIETEKWETKDDTEVRIHQNIYVNNSNHKKILLGKNGDKIKKISMQARQEIEKYLEKKIHLYLFIKQKKKNTASEFME